jgi:sigma-B regulation protein RsbU (phosphoserine phosphatase)
VSLARRSATQPGGVLCDRVPHPNGVTTFLMLDVTHDAGLPAVTAAFLHGAFIAAAHPDRAASGIAAQLAAALQVRGGNERWVAFWLAQAERHGEVTTCSAGFRGALWVPADGGALVPLARGGPEAGAPAMPRYEEETFRLLPGDLLIAASEGLLNARNAAGRPFGPERLREVVEESRRLPIERLSAAVCDAAVQHSGHSTPAEDAMVLALHYRASD